MLLASCSQREKWAAQLCAFCGGFGEGTRWMKLTCWAARMPGLCYRSHACVWKSQAMHAAVLHSHIIWQLPSADARSHSAHRLFRAMCMFSPSHPHTAALDSPNIKQSAYLHLYCVYQSGSHYSYEAAAINSRQQENGGRNSQLMIKKWQLASSFHSSRARLSVCWQIWTSKPKINHFLLRAATNYNK